MQHTYTKKMEVNRLNQDELLFEMAIRGLPSNLLVDEMRKLLRASLKREQTPNTSFQFPKHPFKVEEDKASIENKISAIKAAILGFSGDKNSSPYKRIITMVEWTRNRLEKMLDDDEKFPTFKKETRVCLLSMLSELDGKLQQTDNSEEENEFSDALNQEELLSSTRRESGNTRFSYKGKSIVEKWDLKFNGNTSVMSLNAFLERVSEKCESQGISEDELFRMAIDLFVDKALIWFRSVKPTVSSWSDLVKELKEEFLPFDYDDKLGAEIRRRTQSSMESIGIYLAVMRGLFARLNKAWTEEKQLRVLLQNIHPYYQSGLGLVEIKTTDELLRLCRKLEANRASIDNFLPPPSRKHSQLEPDMAAIEETHKEEELAAFSQGNKTFEGNRDPPRKRFEANRADIICFNCKKPGHRAVLCPSPPCCFLCKTVGVVFAQCVKCNPSLQNQAENN